MARVVQARRSKSAEPRISGQTSEIYPSINTLRSVQEEEEDGLTCVERCKKGKVGRVFVMVVVSQISCGVLQFYKLCLINLCC